MREYESVALAYKAVEDAVDKLTIGTGTILRLRIALVDLRDELYNLGVPVFDLTDDTDTEEN